MRPGGHLSLRRRKLEIGKKKKKKLDVRDSAAAFPEMMHNLMSSVENHKRGITASGLEHVDAMTKERV